MHGDRKFGKQLTQTEKIMAFVNEYVSQEDIKKYRLDEKFLQSNPVYKVLPENFKPSWTVDKDRNIYLMGAGMANRARDEEYWIRFLLNCDGKEFFIKLERGEGSKNYSESPYIVVWDKLLSIDPPNLHGAAYADIVSLLKEALSVVGDDGLTNKFAPNCIVKFNF
jgi:hypothetical protein